MPPRPSVGCVRVLLAGALLSLSSGLSAQVEDLSIQGTAAYNRLWHTASVVNRGLRPGGSRFSGRVAVRIRRGVYIGAGVGSWHVEEELEYGGVPQVGESTSLSMAVTGSLYAQWYPIPSTPVFFRAGSGIAQTRTYLPSQAEGIRTMHVARSTRIAPAFGAGFDIGIGSHLAITGAFDATFLLGHAEGRQVKSALAASIGLTMR